MLASPPTPPRPHPAPRVKPILRPRAKVAIPGPGRVSWNDAIRSEHAHPAAGVGLSSSEDDAAPGTWFPPTDIDSGCDTVSTEVRPPRNLAIQKANRLLRAERAKQPQRKVIVQTDADVTGPPRSQPADQSPSTRVPRGFPLTQPNLPWRPYPWPEPNEDELAPFLRNPKLPTTSPGHFSKPGKFNSDNTPRSPSAVRSHCENAHAGLCRSGWRRWEWDIADLEEACNRHSKTFDKPAEAEIPTDAAVPLGTGKAVQAAVPFGTGRKWDDGIAAMEEELQRHNETSSRLTAVPFGTGRSASPPKFDGFENTALVDGVWQSDGSQHASKGQVKPGDSSRPTLTVAAQSGQTTLKVAYFFSGIRRKA